MIHYLTGPVRSAYGSISPAAVRHLLAGDDAPEIEIYSPGGDAHAGIEIAQMIAEHGSVTCRVRTLAASAASLLAVAGRRLEMSDQARVMIHEPITWSGGTWREIRSTADRLEDMSGITAAWMAERCHLTVDQVRDLQERETWWSRTAMVAAGFAVAGCAARRPAGTSVVEGGPGDPDWDAVAASWRIANAQTTATATAAAAAAAAGSAGTAAGR